VAPTQGLTRCQECFGATYSGQGAKNCNACKRGFYHNPHLVTATIIRQQQQQQQQQQEGGDDGGGDGGGGDSGNNNKNQQCVLCPLGVSCGPVTKDGAASLAHLPLKKGFWRSEKTSDEVIGKKQKRSITSLRLKYSHFSHTSLSSQHSLFFQHPPSPFFLFTRMSVITIIDHKTLTPLT
jgi:hypothetical protein